MLRSLKRSQSVRHVSQLVTGTAIAQVAPLLVTPILTRLFSPAQFGEFGVFAALLMGASIVISGRYEIAIPLPARDQDGMALFGVSIAISAVFGALLLAAVAAMLSLDATHSLESLGASRTTLLLLPIGVLAASLMQSCGYWFTRIGAFSLVARGRSALGVLTAILSVALGLMRIRDGLVLSMFLSYCLVAGAMTAVLLRRSAPLIKDLRVSAMRAAAREYREFPLLNCPNALLDAVRDTGSLMAFTALFGAAATGFLSQTLRVLRAPMSLIGQAVGQVFFPKASRMHAQDRSIHEITRKTMLGLAAISIPMYLLVAITGPALFALVFGPQWAVAGEYARTLSPWLALVLVLSSVSMLPVIRRQQRKALALNAVETATRFAAIAAGASLGGASGALKAWTLAGLSVGVVQLGWYWRLSRSGPSSGGSIQPAPPGNTAPASPRTPDEGLRVLVVSHLYPESDSSSAGIFVKEQAEALSEIADVTVVVGRYLPARDLAPSDRRGRLTVHEVALPRFRPLPPPFRIVLAIPFYYRAVMRTISGEPPFDVIHAHFGVPDGIAGTMLSKALSLPLVITLHGSDFNRQLALPVIGRMFGRTIASAEKIVGVSEQIATGMRARFELDEDRVIHVANGYNRHEITPHTTRDPAYFLFMGALIPRKNPDVLVRAFATIAEEVPLDLVMVGEGPMAAGLQDLARELGVESRVLFEGQQEHAALDGYLERSAALVLPSRSEGMPIVVNEALASGTPVVASDLPGTAQQISSKEFGRLVPVGDIRALADAMLDAARTDWDYARIAAECQVPTWDDYARTLEGIYLQAIELRTTRGEGAA